MFAGRGTISWISPGEATDLDLKKGDIYRIGSGSVFYVRSHPDPLRQKLRIHAIFTPPTSDSSAISHSFLPIPLCVVDR